MEKDKWASGMRCTSPRRRLEGTSNTSCKTSWRLILPFADGDKPMVSGNIGENARNILWKKNQKSLKGDLWRNVEKRHFAYSGYIHKSVGWIQVSGFYN
jgi:hypothetical protein